MTDSKETNNENKEENFDETNNENVKDAEIVNLSNQSKGLSNSVNLNINFSDISRAITIIKQSSIEELKNILENSKNLQDNNFQSIKKMIEEAKDLDLEKIKFILEYMDNNTKEEHEHARKVQQENNRHDEEMADKVLAGGIIALVISGIFAWILSSNSDNNDNGNKLK